MALNDGERLKGLRLAQCKLALFQLILSLEQSHYVINRGRIDKFLNIRTPLASHQAQNQPEARLQCEPRR
jgi:hypothetical protein